MTEVRKLIISRWQWDVISNTLIGNVPGGIQAWMDIHYKIRTTPAATASDGVGIHYIFFGFKQELTKWRLANNISPKDTTLARDWSKLQGLRARPVPVYEWGWMKNNVRHEITTHARGQIYQLEAMYGSGPDLYRSYEGEGNDKR